MPDRCSTPVSKPDAVLRVHGVIFLGITLLRSGNLESRAGSDLRHTVRQRKLQQGMRETESRYPPRRWGFGKLIKAKYREDRSLGRRHSERPDDLLSAPFTINAGVGCWVKNLKALLGHKPRLGRTETRSAPSDETPFHTIAHRSQIHGPTDRLWEVWGCGSSNYIDFPHNSPPLRRSSASMRRTLPS
jgi:hypothetical protein